MQKPKILIALFRLPYPATDGTRYKILYNLATGLKKDFDVEFFVVSIKSFKPEDLARLEQEFGKVHVFSHSKLGYLLRSLPALVSGLPLQAEAFRFRDAQHWLDAHVDDYDAVYIHEIRMTEFFIRYSDDRKKKFLVDFNDAISMNYRASVANLSFPKKLFYRWEGVRVSRYESKVLSSFAHFNIVSDTDRQYLLNAPAYTGSKDLDFGVIAHGAPMVRDTAPIDEQKIFFMGSLDYEPNRDALVHFLKTVWPKVALNHPNVEFLVVGGGKVPFGYEQVPRVRFLGFVPNVFEAVRHCKALVAPIRFAGGTPSKILEAMGYGIPVVTTPNGATGIAGAENFKNMLMIADSNVDAWVSTIKNLLDDSEFRMTIAQNARKLVEERYSASAAQAAFLERFHQISGK